MGNIVTDTLRVRIAALIDREYLDGTSFTKHNSPMALRAADAVIEALNLTEYSGVIVGCAHD